MIYNVNLGKWNSVFAVPSELVDKYLAMSNEVQIKVLLWMLRHAGQELSLSEITKAMNLSEEEVKNAVAYWNGCNMMAASLDDNDPITQKPCKTATACENVCSCENPKREASRYLRPDSNYIADRMQNSGDIYFLMQEAQVILGRPISNGDSAILLMLHDNDGLPVDVIIMLMQYAVGAGKASMKYIEKMGISWASEGINNLEKSEKKIQDLNKANISWRKFENIIGIYHRSPSSREEEAVTRWFDEWNYSDELIKEAYDRCVNANGKYILKYMDSIIKRWYSQGIVTIEQALIENANRNRKKGFSVKDNRASYNIEEYENYNIFDHIEN